MLSKNQVKYLHSLRLGKFRELNRVFIAEGIKLVDDLLNSHFRIHIIYGTQAWIESHKRVLAGGADSLCRLTYYGFNSLQLIDPEGARPLDKDRRGMSVAEGAAMLLLVANEPEDAIVEVLGAGLSCDAHHPVMPQPEGQGALAEPLEEPSQHQVPWMD